MKCHSQPKKGGESHHGHHDHDDHHHPQSNTLMIRMLISLALTLPFFVNMIMSVFFNTELISGMVQLILALCIEVVGGSLFIIATIRGLKKLSFDMNTLVAIGTSSAFLLSLYNLFFGQSHLLYFDSSALIITFVLIGLVIEDKTQGKANRSLQALLSLQPKETVLVSATGEKSTVLVEKIQLEDRLLVKAGQVLPVDGELDSEEGVFDESSLTGESQERRKTRGDKVFAGTVNVTHSVTIRAKVLGSETVIGKTIELVKKASEQKPSIQRLADTISSFFVPLVIGIAIITFLIWFFVGSHLEAGVLAAISVLVIACPCALGMATPIVTLVASVKMAKAGILIREIEPFFRAYKIKNIIFDKTGTLTEKKLSVNEITGPGLEDEYAGLLLALTQHSDHPISHAIAQYLSSKFQSQGEVSRVKTTPGLGFEGEWEGKVVFFGSLAFLSSLGKTVLPEWIEAKGGTSSFLFIEDRFVCRVDLSSKIKESAKGVVDFLKNKGIGAHLVSGDSKEASEFVAKSLGIEHVKSQALPADKLTYLEALAKEGRVGMVGDGINDAPALVKADVSFAMGDGIDVAMKSSAIGLVHGDINDIIKTLVFSKKANHTIYTNFVFAFLFNVVGIGVAAVGLLHPGIAAAAMAASSFLVVANSVLLLKRG